MSTIGDLSGGSFGASSSGTYTITTTNVTSPFPYNVFLAGADSEVDPCAGGHHLNEDLIEGADGFIVGYCEDCNVRVTLDRVPGGAAAIRIRALLAGIMGLETENEVIDEPACLLQFVRLRDELAAEDYALEESQELLDLAYKMLIKKLERAA